jgi:hypothetical protein
MVRTWKPTVAGILEIVSGSIAALMGFGALIFGQFVGSGWMRDWMMNGTWDETWGGMSDQMVQALITVGGVFIILVGAVAIIGGICALRRKVWGLALAGGICALFPPVAFAALGILSIIFIALSRKEFS